ncbi:hypothetical protein [Natronolimnobius baerhuensis]|uniref:Uncharacterized protein n=1 Tax=Natronolimnobius baerhuensis TaxID=253108 RepID=A0A202E5D1_9EURY|nr:hypothetical protein [Natronolimnobius baerhuensis]OVE83388.1 hypothetical protein B2G88_13080 [Natronolimnobius baerhuensis]
MTENAISATDEEEGSRIWREVFFVAAVSALFLVPSDARTVVSPDVLVVTVTGGLVLGVIVHVVFSRIQIGRLSGGQQVLALLMTLGSVYILAWVLLPVGQYAFLAHFAVAFLWGATLTQVAATIRLDD